MKILEAKRDELLRPLQAVTGIVERRHTLPILSNVLIERSGQQLHLVATDLEIQVTARFALADKGAGDQKVTVSARKLVDILRSLPEESPVALDVQANKVQVKAGKSRFSLQSLPADDFPRLAEAAGAAVYRLSQARLRALLLLVQYAMAQQDIRYYLNGMLLVIGDGQLKAVATDGHRLAFAAESIGDTRERQEVILPRKAVLELVKLLAETDDEVALQVGANQVRFEFGGISLVSKVVDGKFPDYGRVIPTNYKKEFAVERTRLQQALQRVAILSNEKFRGVRWMLAGGSLRISCTNTEQEEATEELEIGYSGEALDIGFNVTYLLDVLNNIASDQVTCGFGDASSSVLVTIAERPEFRYVVMPMRI